MIFNRAEPISLTNQFYEILINWQKNGAKILPDPYLNNILGDKLAIDAIHYHKTIAGIDLLDGIWIKNQENQISFATKIINISSNKLSGEEIIQFYDLLIANNFAQAKELFSEEYQAFMQGAKEYLAFHIELDGASVLKPLSYFGGIGIVVEQNKTFGLKLAIQNIIKSFLAIKQDCLQKSSPDLARLSTIIIQEVASEAHLGDLRIVLCGGDLLGIFVRVNRNFARSNINNLGFGGHPESLFKHYPISKDGVDLMIADMKNSGISDEDEKIKKAQALYGLLRTIDFLKQIKIFKQYPIVGVDALLTKNKDGSYRYGINEINLTSPMGITQLLILKMVVKFSDLTLQSLVNNGFPYKINFQKYQILSDYFIGQNRERALQAKEILLLDHQLKKIVIERVRRLLDNSHFAKILQCFQIIHN